MHRIYAVSYAVYYWSEWLIFVALAALFVIPFTSLDARFAAWCIALLVCFLSAAASGISQALCRALICRHRAQRQFTDEESHKIDFLEQQRQASHVASEAGRPATERHQQTINAWWINRNRI